LIEDKKPKFFYGYIVVAVAFIISAVFSGTLYCFGIFFEPLLSEFGWTRTTISAAVSLYSLLMGSLTIVAGRLTDRFGPKIVVTGSGFFLGSGYLLMSQLSAIWQLYLFYGVLVGIGMSAGAIPALSLVARWFTKRRAMMTGIVMAGGGVGTMITPLLANWLISTYSWRVSFIILGIIASVLIILAAQFLRREPSQMGLLPYGANEVEGGNSYSEAGGLSLQQAIHTRQFWLVCALSFFYALAQAPIMVHVVIHAIGLGFSASSAAIILSILGAMTVAGKLTWGTLADRIGNNLVLIIGFILISCALFWLIPAKEMWMFYLFAAVFGFAIGCWVAIIGLIADLFGMSSHGTFLGCASCGSMIGVAVGAPLAGYIFDSTHSYQLAWAACATAGIISVILTFLLRQTRSQVGGEK